MIGKDKYGQPILVIRVRLNNTKIMSGERARCFFLYLIEEAIRNMGDDVEKYILIVDFKSAGLSNLKFKQIKELAPVLQVN